MSKLLRSLGHTGRRRVVWDRTLNTQTLTKTNEQEKRFKQIYNFVFGRILSHPGLYAARGLGVDTLECTVNVYVTKICS